MCDTFEKYPEVGYQIDAIIMRLQDIRDNPSHLCDVGCGMSYISETLLKEGKAAIDLFYANQKIENNFKF